MHGITLSHYCRMFLAAILSTLMSTYSLAITNIEDERINPQVDGWSGQVNFSIDGKSGNSKKENIYVGAKAIHRKDSHTTLIIAESEYGESFDKKDANSHFVHLRFIQAHSERIANEQYLQFQDDEFKLLDGRVLAGGGIRYLLTPKLPDLKLHLGVGAYYTKEKWAEVDGQIEEDYARASFYLSYKQQITDNIFLLNTLYAQPRLSQASDLYVFNEFSIKVQVYQALAFRISLKSSHDSDPVGGLEETDHSYHSSLVYDF